MGRSYHPPLRSTWRAGTTDRVNCTSRSHSLSPGTSERKAEQNEINTSITCNPSDLLRREPAGSAVTLTMKVKGRIFISQVACHLADKDTRARD